MPTMHNSIPAGSLDFVVRNSHSQVSLYIAFATLCFYPVNTSPHVNEEVTHLCLLFLEAKEGGEVNNVMRGAQLKCMRRSAADYYPPAPCRPTQSCATQIPREREVASVVIKKSQDYVNDRMLCCAWMSVLTLFGGSIRSPQL